MSSRKNEARWIEKRKRWQINVQSDGERRTFTDSTTGKKGKIACERKADKWLDTKLVGENTRVEAMLDRWYERIKRTTSFGYYNQYEKYIRIWIKPVIGTKRIGRLTQQDLQDVIDKAYDSGKLAKKTLMNIRGCMMTFMKFCRDSKATQFHPETLSIPNGARISKKKVATSNDIKTLFTKSTTKRYGKEVEDIYIHAYRFMVLTGMRPGERTALKPECIKGNKVTIYESINDEGNLTPGKNDNARRTYLLDYHAVKVLDDQVSMLQRLGWISAYVFPDYDRGFIPQDKFRKAWKRYCEANGITGAPTPYELRHTWVSINKKMPDGLKKLIVGHSKDMDTDGTYGHEMEGDMEEAAEYMSDAFKKILGW
jgi:integrase